MKVKQALKAKNKLVNELNEEFSKVLTYNSVVEGQERPYDPKESYSNVIAKLDELVALKTSIHKANARVYEKIFRLAELKSLTAKLKGLDCSSGKSTHWRSDAPVNKTAVISILEKDLLIKGLEKEIETLQEELDFHNSKTSI